MTNVLLLTGQNNHDWKRSSVFVKGLLEETGRYTVSIAEDPNQPLAKIDNLQQYGLFFLDYNGPDWDKQAKSNFEASIRAGIGLVVMHYASAFSGWVEYRKMLGLVYRHPPSGHGDYHEFEVKIINREHPLTRGLDDFRIYDELYHNLVRVQDVPIEVLATAYSSPDKKGSGKNEPIMLVSSYGSGRIFHLVLGHVWPQGVYKNYLGETMMTFENSMFQEVLLRGCDWVATGEVKGVADV